MEHWKRTRLFAFVSLIMLLMQFPVVNVTVPVKNVAASEAQMPLSVVQVAVSAFREAGKNNRVPEPVLKALMLPGLLLHDVFNTIQCKSGNEDACSAPSALPQYEELFSLTEPLCDTKVIMQIVKKNFPKGVELMQAGSTITIGSAIFSLLYPIKFGFFGYLMIMFAMYQDQVSPAFPGLAFLPIFALATDIGSMFNRSASMRGVESSKVADAETAASPDTKVTPDTKVQSKSRQAQGGREKKKSR